MRRWEGPGGPVPGSSESRAQELPKLERGDFVAVWLDPFVRGGKKEGTARLLSFRNVCSGRAPLEVWKVSLVSIEVRPGVGELELEERPELTFGFRVVHPADLLAKGSDIPARPKGAAQVSLLEDDLERARR